MTAFKLSSLKYDEDRMENFIYLKCQQDYKRLPFLPIQLERNYVYTLLIPPFFLFSKKVYRGFTLK